MVSELTSLTVLDLRDNSISSISALSGLTSLTRLELHFNSIRSITALTGLTSLTDLFLSDNSISDISALGGLTNLRQLALNTNTYPKPFMGSSAYVGRLLLIIDYRLANFKSDPETRAKDAAAEPGAGLLPLRGVLCTVIVEEAERVVPGTASNEVADGSALVDTKSTRAWVGAVPAVCAVHCLVTPLLASTLPFFAHTTVVETWLLALSVMMAFASLAVSWRSHGRWVVWGLAAFGFLVWGTAVAGSLELLPEAVVAPVGGSLVAVSLFWNGRLRHKAVCASCACPVHPVRGSTVGTPRPRRVIVTLLS